MLDQKAIAAIEYILKRGNNAVIKKKKNGVIVMEEVRKTKYGAGSIASR